MNHSQPAPELASPFFFVVGHVACGICGYRADFSAKGPYGALREISEHLAEHFEELGRGTEPQRTQRSAETKEGA